MTHDVLLFALGICFAFGPAIDRWFQVRRTARPASLPYSARSGL